MIEKALSNRSCTQTLLIMLAICLTSVSLIILLIQNHSNDQSIKDDKRFLQEDSLFFPATITQSKSLENSDNYHHSKGSTKKSRSFDKSNGYVEYLQRSYHSEISRNRINQSLPSAEQQVHSNNQVCFLVRTHRIHNTAPHHAKLQSRFLGFGVEGLIKSLLRQSNPNWKAFFFLPDTPMHHSYQSHRQSVNTNNHPHYHEAGHSVVGDSSTVASKLKELLASHLDQRLQFSPLPSSHRPSAAPEDAGYSTVDEVIHQIGSSNPQCRWFTVTESDNSYGSSVVEYVLNFASTSNKMSEIDLVLAPMDNKEFAELDKVKKSSEKRWNDHCLQLLQLLKSRGLTYVTQPLPQLSRVKLSSMFFKTKKFLEEDINFRNFTNPLLHPCRGCQDGYMAQYLVRHRSWKYTRLPIDGLKSLVFQSLSPTLCVAAGHVWLDYPQVHKSGCLAHRTVRMMKHKEGLHGNSSSVFDWEYFDSLGGGRDREGKEVGYGQWCLRLNQQAYFKHSNDHVGGIHPITLRRRLENEKTSLNSENPTEEPFDWIRYLDLNPDLERNGINTKEAATTHYLRFGRSEGRIFSAAVQVPGFDWHDYLEQNPDLIDAGINNKMQAVAHFLKAGVKEGRPFNRLSPDKRSLEEVLDKIKGYISDMGREGSTTIDRRNLVVYHVKDMGSSTDSLEVITNNIKLFVSSLTLHDPHNSTQQAFYLFNVVGMMNNPMLDLIPNISLPNVAVLEWEVAHTVMATHTRTLELLGPTVLLSFSSIFFTTAEVRGPLFKRANGGWIAEYKKLLDLEKVGLVGPTIRCPVAFESDFSKGLNRKLSTLDSAYVQTHFFAMRSTLVLQVLEELQQYRNETEWRNLDQYFSYQGFSPVAKRLGFRLGSLLSFTRLGDSGLVGGEGASVCVDGNSYNFPPTWSQGTVALKEGTLGLKRSWCTVDAREVLFFMWSGDGLKSHLPGDLRFSQQASTLAMVHDKYYCGKAIDMSDSAVLKMNLELQRVTRDVHEGLRISPFTREWSFVLKEPSAGGVAHELYKQYLEEKFSSTSSVSSTTDKIVVEGSLKSEITKSGSDKSNIWADAGGLDSEEESKVCFIMVAPSEAPGWSSLRPMDLLNVKKTGTKNDNILLGMQDFIQSLKQQSSSQWSAHYFTDKNNENEKIKELLTSYQDQRLHYNFVESNQIKQIFDDLNHINRRLTLTKSQQNPSTNELSPSTNTNLNLKSKRRLKLKTDPNMFFGPDSFLGGIVKPSKSALDPLDTDTEEEEENGENTVKEKEKVLNNRENINNEDVDIRTVESNPTAVTEKTEKSTEPLFSEDEVRVLAVIEFAFRSFKEKKECSLISIVDPTKTIFGSDVVNSVLKSVSKASPSVDLFLAPVDTSEILLSDLHEKKEIPSDQFCTNFESIFALTAHGFSRQPSPFSPLQLSGGLFMRRDKIAQQKNTFFGEMLKSSEWIGLNLLSTKDSSAKLKPLHYLTLFLVGKLGWSYESLALNGLNTVVFEGSSPTLCVASGNVWLDHVDPRQVRCVSQESVQLFHDEQHRVSLGEGGGGEGTKWGLFDWGHFLGSDRWCLRLSTMGVARAKHLLVDLL